MSLWGYFRIPHKKFFFVFCLFLSSPLFIQVFPNIPVLQNYTVELSVSILLFSFCMLLVLFAIGLKRGLLVDKLRKGLISDTKIKALVTSFSVTRTKIPGWYFTAKYIDPETNKTYTYLSDVYSLTTSDNYSFGGDPVSYAKKAIAQHVHIGDQVVVHVADKYHWFYFIDNPYPHITVRNTKEKIHDRLRSAGCGAYFIKFLLLIPLVISLGATILLGYSLYDAYVINTVQGLGWPWGMFSFCLLSAGLTLWGIFRKS